MPILERLAEIAEREDLPELLDVRAELFTLRYAAPTPVGADERVLLLRVAEALEALADGTLRVQQREVADIRADAALLRRLVASAPAPDADGAVAVERVADESGATFDVVRLPDGDGGEVYARHVVSNGYPFWWVKAEGRDDTRPERGIEGILLTALAAQARAAEGLGRDLEHWLDACRRAERAYDQGTEAERERLEQARLNGMGSEREARPESEWHEDVGPVLWWRFPVSEPPYAGTPLDSDWPGYHTHWTPITVPVLAAPTGGEGRDNGE